jgi:hypothetical protein
MFTSKVKSLVRKNILPKKVRIFEIELPPTLRSIELRACQSQEWYQYSV